LNAGANLLRPPAQTVRSQGYAPKFILTTENTEKTEKIFNRELHQLTHIKKLVLIICYVAQFAVTFCFFIKFLQDKQ
jgi:hypothetical protein